LPVAVFGFIEANGLLKKGEHKQAMDTLKLANIDVSFVMEVAPLDRTTSGIKEAAKLIEAGKYYEANQALKGVEDGFRFDVRDVDSTPKEAAGETSSQRLPQHLRRSSETNCASVVRSWADAASLRQRSIPGV